jgi:hypothetical protein
MMHCKVNRTSHGYYTWTLLNDEVHVARSTRSFGLQGQAEADFRDFLKVISQDQVYVAIV